MSVCLCSAKPLTDLRTVSLQVETFSTRADDAGEFESNRVFPFIHLATAKISFVFVKLFSHHVD